ncbi:MAG TPA: hypothetical protein PKD54_10640, partial [Pirellulaceae bacterium]|nr:hypothetical protein [Pirellulaceae bacterium]
WHRELAEINDRLRKSLVDELRQLDALYELAVQHQQQRATALSREYAFCCFPEALADVLHQRINSLLAD